MIRCQVNFICIAFNHSYSPKGIYRPYINPNPSPPKGMLLIPDGTYDNFLL